jgi:hypothetical protein
MLTYGSRTYVLSTFTKGAKIIDSGNYETFDHRYQEGHFMIQNYFERRDKKVYFSSQLVNTIFWFDTTKNKVFEIADLTL